MCSKRPVLLSIFLMFLSVSVLAAEPADQAIFNGASLEGWRGNAMYWRIADGAITGEIPDGKTLDHNEFIFWDGSLADFDLSLDFRISGGRDANSGIQFRSQRMESGAAAGYQADMD